MNRFFEPDSMTPPCTGARQRFRAADRVCYCISTSDATTSDQRAIATDQGKAQSGSKNQQATGHGRNQSIQGGKGALAAGDRSASVGGSVSVETGTKVSGTGNQVTITNNGGADQLASLGQSLKGSVDAQTVTLSSLIRETSPPAQAPVNTAADNGATAPTADNPAPATDADKAKARAKVVTALGVAGALASLWFIFFRKKA